MTTKNNKKSKRGKQLYSWKDKRVKLLPVEVRRLICYVCETRDYTVREYAPMPEVELKNGVTDFDPYTAEITEWEIFCRTCGYKTGRHPTRMAAEALFERLFYRVNLRRVSEIKL